MKILFLGDSITQGIPGVSYVDLFEKDSGITCVNRGKGGDTVSSLLRRVKYMKDLGSYDAIVLFIGVNDVFGRINWTHKVFKYIRRQVWEKDVESFEKHYRNLLKTLLQSNQNILVVPPLLVGEQLQNIYNKTLHVFRESIKTIVKEHEVSYVDVYEAFVEYLQGKESSNYLPHSLVQIYKDTKVSELETLEELSAKRGLFLTLDGVHLNKEGANILASLLNEYIQKAKNHS